MRTVCMFAVDLTNGQLTPNNNTPLLAQALSGEDAFMPFLHEHDIPTSHNCIAYTISRNMPETNHLTDSATFTKSFSQHSNNSLYSILS